MCLILHSSPSIATWAVQLESIVTLPSEYIRAVSMIKNETDVTKLPLEDILPQATVMVVSVTASTTNGTQVCSTSIEELVAMLFYDIVLLVDDECSASLPLNAAFRGIFHEPINSCYLVILSYVYCNIFKKYSLPSTDIWLIFILL